MVWLTSPIDGERVPILNWQSTRAQPLIHCEDNAKSLGVRPHRTCSAAPDLDQDQAETTELPSKTAKLTGPDECNDKSLTRLLLKRATRISWRLSLPENVNFQAAADQSTWRVLWIVAVVWSWFRCRSFSGITDPSTHHTNLWPSSILNTSSYHLGHLSRQKTAAQHLLLIRLPGWFQHNVSSHPKLVSENLHQDLPKSIFWEACVLALLPAKQN